MKQRSLLDVCHNPILYAAQDLKYHSNELLSSIKTEIFLHYLSNNPVFYQDPDL
jgi:hypothetical protein